MVRNVKIKSKWKPVEIDVTLIDQTQLQHLACFEELTEYEILGDDIGETNIEDDDDDNVSKEATKKKKKNKRKRKLKSQNESEKADNKIEESETISDIRSEVVPKQKNKSNKRKATDDDRADSTKCRKIDQDCVKTNEDQISSDMSAWKDLFVPQELLKCLGEMGYFSPTPIQSLSLPPAIRDKLDIIGAAETGSGKTLSFAIPIVHHILMEQNKVGDEIDDDVDLTDDDDDDNADNDDDTNLSDDQIDNIEMAESNDEEDSSEEHDVVMNSDDDDIDDDDENEKQIDKNQSKSKLRALILLPTRELALQVRDHINKITKYTDIKCVAIVGGMAAQKQTRLLRGKPQIVVATPGRLWELISSGDEHLSRISEIGYLVIDEADRMVEKGHFQELTNIINILNANTVKASRRQTFVFSATLTFVHSKPHWLDLKKKRKKKAHQITTKEKLDDLVARIGFRGKPKIIDLTKKQGTAETLVESRINCSIEEKDFYLYYFLQRYPARTLVFVNSKDSARRLVSLFTLLRCSPLPLHSDMHQKQRLKNLDRFKANSSGFLVATDVAARGLDIQDIEHVIHYQVPQTTENYVHRSGRTARAQKEGLSVMLIGPDDAKNYNKIIKSLKRSEDLPMFPVEVEYMNEIKSRIILARDIEVQQHRLTKKRKQRDWFEQAAKEADIILDDDLDFDPRSRKGRSDDDSDDDDDDREMSMIKQRQTELNRQLQAMLRTPLTSSRGSAKYPTKSGKLNVPYMLGNDEKTKAVSAVKKENSSATESQQDSVSNKKKRKKRNRKNKKTVTDSAISTE